MKVFICPIDRFATATDKATYRETKTQAVNYLKNKGHTCYSLTDREEQTAGIYTYKDVDKTDTKYEAKINKYNSLRYAEILKKIALKGCTAILTLPVGSFSLSAGNSAVDNLELQQLNPVVPGTGDVLVSDTTKTVK